MDFDSYDTSNAWSILDQIQEVIIILNNNLEIKFYNQYSIKILYPQKETNYIGLHFNEFMKICNKEVRIQNNKLINNILIEDPLHLKQLKLNQAVIKKNPIWIVSGQIVVEKQDAYNILAKASATITGHTNDLKLTPQNYIDEIKDFFENIIKQMPCYVYWKDKNFRYMYINDLTAQIMGLNSPNEVIGKTDYDFGWEKTLVDSYRANDIKIINSGKEIRNLEEDLIDRNGVVYHTLVNKLPIKAPNGEVIGILGITVDVTNIKEIELQLKAAKEAAEMASVYKTEFIANMSHDIRTPLSGVVGLGEKVEREIENPTHRALVHDMVRSSYELLNMLNEILDVVSSENITVEDISREPFDLPHLVQTIMDLEQSSVDLKKIELLSSIDKKIPAILLGDHKKVHHIILNLVGNAIKFTKQGHVDINIKLLERNNDAVNILFEIKDTGMGISPENLGKIFELFYKVTPSHKGLDKGHGIGLHIVKTYTELLGGRITVESKLDEGSKFSFNLTFKIPDKDTCPLNITQASLTKRKDKQPIVNNDQIIKMPAPVLEAANAPKILIIEDNDVVRMVAEDMVRTAHCNPTTANDGETGLELAKKQPFDLILSDIGLPGISGIEFAKKLRQYEKDNNKNPVPIVAVTGHGQTVQQECLEAGINHVIIKPMKLETLTELCNEFALFDKEQKPFPSFDKPALQSTALKQGALGPDLPNTEAELFEIDNLPIFDMENAQRILGNNTTLLMQVLRDSINITIPNELPRIIKAHEDNDWVKVSDIVHKLKGGFLSVSLTRLGVACQYLERYHQAGHTASLEKLYQQFIKVLEVTAQQLKPWTE